MIVSTRPILPGLRGLLAIPRSAWERRGPRQTLAASGLSAWQAEETAS